MMLSSRPRDGFSARDRSSRRMLGLVSARSPERVPAKNATPRPGGLRLVVGHVEQKPVSPLIDERRRSIDTSQARAARRNARRTAPVDCGPSNAGQAASRAVPREAVAQDMSRRVRGGGRSARPMRPDGNRFDRCAHTPTRGVHLTASQGPAGVQISGEGNTENRSSRKQIEQIATPRMHIPRYSCPLDPFRRFRPGRVAHARSHRPSQ